MVRCSITRQEAPLSRHDAFMAGWSFVELQLRGLGTKYRVYSPEVTAQQMFDDLWGLVQRAGGREALEATVHHVPLSVDELAAGKGRDVPRRRR